MTSEEKLPAGRKATIRRTYSVVKPREEEAEEDTLQAEAHFEKTLHGLFEQLDLNRDGVLSPAEVRESFRRLGLPCGKVHMEALFGEGFFEGGIGSTSPPSLIRLEDFVKHAMGRRDRLMAVWEELDSNNDGLVFVDDIQRALRRLDIKASDAQVLKLMRRSGDGGGHMGLEDFTRLMLLAPGQTVAEHFDAYLAGAEFGEGTGPVTDDFEDLNEELITLLAGCAAGGISRTSTAPLDRLKVQLQASRISRRMSIPAGLRALYADGGIRGLWTSNGVNCCKVMPETACRFLAFDAFKVLICNDLNDVQPSERFLAGSLAGFTAQTLIYPLEIVKTRLAVAKVGDYRGVGDCLKRLLKEGGTRALYRGLGPSLIGIVPYSGVDLGLFYTLKDQWLKANPCAEEGPGVLTLVGFGAISSSVGQVTAYPLQLVRTKLQADTAVPRRYEGMVDCFRQTIQTDGLRGLYRGLAVNFLKALPAITVSYVVFEKSKFLLTQRFGKRQASAC